ncbi:MAG: sugar-binding transcriptional regulator [Geminicoccaceae bacterium]|nr:sugar-binding transcriptional regulator [Geminicoccaceae bacterium]MCB9943583.1 sugar-binding transcriptional regulator [Geminicoccaceae bacterium]
MTGPDALSHPKGAIDRRRDDAARAAWLYFVAGRTQDDIARQLNVSRQAAQRLVAQAVSERLVNFRIDHPIAWCAELAERLVERYSLEFCDVVPTDLAEPSSIRTIAVATAGRLNRIIASKAPVILCVGTGRTLRASVDHLEEMDRPQHKVLSLVGNMANDGRASPYEVAMRIADRIGAQRYPLAAPVIAASAEECAILQGLPTYQAVSRLYTEANVSFLGVSEVAWQSPLHRDGFASDLDIADLLNHGAVGELVGRSFDVAGKIVDCPTNRKVASLPLPVPPRHLTVISGGGPKKSLPIRAALEGRFANALITDEQTAAMILDAVQPELLSAE